MKRALLLTHAEFEGPGRIAPLLEAKGYELETRALQRGVSLPKDLRHSDLLVVMGGPMGVGDLERAEFPFLRAEVELLRERIREDAPVLGVCLGAQLLAHAAGASVFPMMRQAERLYEVGWAPIQLHVSCDARVLAGLPNETVVLHWHGDTFDLPSGALRLASSERCENQAFQLGQRVFGLQFHCEVTSEDIENFLRADEAFVNLANGIGAGESIRRETAAYMPGYRKVGDSLLDNIIQAMAAS
ncbi:MAG TPA: gamma-glutamyl-gamma-aminobutyrate hydrolase family protein [Polyangiaceae bacterium]|nr:gamma-glutamyl-gamma-aminobutyrate hydrolase family protein [Polyangiaceae bacterium]